MARLQQPVLAGALFHRCARGAFGITILARAHTNSRKWSSRNCSPRLELADSTVGPCRYDARGIEAAADWDSLKSPENYLGYDRTENFASGGKPVLDEPRIYEVPERLSLNEWGLSGEWTVKEGDRRTEQAQWTHRVSFSRPRSSSRHGAGSARNVREISRADRRTAARRSSRN